METIKKTAQKGDMLFVGEDEDTLAVSILDTLTIDGNKYLKIIATPIMVEQVSNDTANAEFAKEITKGDKYFLEPVVDPIFVEALKNAFKNKSTISEKEPSNA